MVEEEEKEMLDDEDDVEDYFEKDIPEKTYTFKCKPCYNFQSVEFEYTGTEYDLVDMMELYGTIVKMLKDIAPEQTVATKQVIKDPASEKQLSFLKKLGVKVNRPLSKQEAWNLINEAKESR